MYCDKCQPSLSFITIHSNSVVWRCRSHIIIWKISLPSTFPNNFWVLQSGVTRWTSWPWKTSSDQTQQNTSDSQMSKPTEINVLDNVQHNIFTVALHAVKLTKRHGVESYTFSCPVANHWSDLNLTYTQLKRISCPRNAPLRLFKNCLCTCPSHIPAHIVSLHVIFEESQNKTHVWASWLELFVSVNLGLGKTFSGRIVLDFHGCII